MKVKATKCAALLGRVFVTLPLLGLAACNLINDDLAKCPIPVVEIRFVYDYNMEYANAFHNQVDCLSAYFFDDAGRLATVQEVNDPQLLADEAFRLRPELPAGSYSVVAYGGMACDHASFAHANPMQTGSKYTDLHVQLDHAALSDPARARLHNHFYGATHFTVNSREDTYATVEMMRNTNSVQVALQHTNGAPIDCNDFIFEVIDDNNDFDHANNLLATGEITYIPYNTENRSTGTVAQPEARAEADDDTPSFQEWHAALAQFAVSRLVPRGTANKQTSTTLRVRRVEDGESVLEIPLVNYMLLFKSDGPSGASTMGNQEYLDRENSWRFVFFLDENSGLWVNNHIIVNDWEVRINDTDF